MNKIVEIFFDVHLSKGHVGLAEYAKKRRFDVTGLKPGQFALFYNRKLSAVKAYGANGVCLYVRNTDNRQFNLRALRLLPRFLSEGDIGYDKALRVVIESEMKQRGL